MDKTCLFCNKYYKVIPCLFERSKYCSRSCKDKDLINRRTGSNHPMFGRKRPDLVLLNKSKRHIDLVTNFHKGRKRSEKTKKLIGIKSRESRLESKWWQGLTNPYKLPNYDSKISKKYYIPKKIRRLVLERDDYTCKECNKNFRNNSKLLHIHHIIPRRNGGTNKLENLISYCYVCHKRKDYNLIQLEKNNVL